MFESLWQKHGWTVLKPQKAYRQSKEKGLVNSLTLVEATDKPQGA